MTTGAGGRPLPVARPRILLLLASTSYRAEDFLDAAEAADARVVVGSDHRQTLADLEPDATVAVSFTDLERSVERIRRLHDDDPFHAVVPAEDEGVLLAAAAAAALGLPHDPPDAVRAARDKARTRARLAEAGLPGPATRLVGLDENPREAARGVPYPCVLKPRSLSASRGVIRADDDDGFVEAVERIAGILAEADSARTAPVDGAEILVEGYIPGREVAVEAVLDHGRLHVLAIFDKPDPLEGPYFQETLFVTPSREADGVQERIVEVVRRTAGALGLRHGPLHAELRVNDEGVWPLEVAPRSIGGRCGRVLRFGAGTGLEELILRQASGMEIPSWQRESAAAGVMMLPIPGRGVLREVGGREMALAVPDIEGLDVTIPLGREVVPLPEGNRYLGFLYARADDPARVEEALRAAFARLEIRVDAGPA